MEIPNNVIKDKILDRSIIGVNIESFNNHKNKITIELSDGNRLVVWATYGEEIEIDYWDKIKL